MKLRVLILSMFLGMSIQAQQWANNWFFGKNMGFNFSDNIANSNVGAQDAFEASAAISDIAGNLLFYTDGLNIYNKNHQLMLNGSSIEGNRSATQGALIIPKPGSPYIYFLFTLDDTLNNAFSLKYSEIDIRLDGGKGAVTGNKNVLLISGLSERMAATFNAEKDGVWLTVRDAFTPTFYTLSITTLGVTGHIQYSQIGSATSSNLGVQIGQMKYSPDGKLLAWVCRGDQFFEVLSFNTKTGLFEQSLRKVQLNLTLGAAAYGIEFSPDKSKLYLSVGNGGLYQYNMLLIDNQLSFESGRIHLNPTLNYSCLGLQLAPDGRMYVAGGNSNSTVHVVSHPNEDASLAGLTFNIIQPQSGFQVREGFPAFISNYFEETKLLIENTCAQQSVVFSTVYNLVDSIHWHFGDLSSGALNFSNALKPMHVYNESGTYVIVRVLFLGSVRDTFQTDIYINPLPEFDLGNDTVMCNGSFIQLESGILDVEYFWNDGSQAPTLRAENQGIYWLDVHLEGCIKRDSILIQVRSTEVDFSIETINHCEEANSFLFYGNSNDSILFWEYDFGNGNRVSQKNATHSFDSVGVHSIQLQTINLYGCESFIGKTVQVYPKPNADIKVSQEKQCFSNQLFEIEFVDNSPQLGQNYWLKFSDGTNYSQMPVGHRFAEPGTYWVNSITETVEGCRDSVVRSLLVYFDPIPAFVMDSSQHCAKGQGINVRSISEGVSASIVNTTFSCNNKTISNTQASFVFELPGIYDVVMEVRDQNGCVSGKTEGFTIYPEPVSRFSTGSSSTCVGNAEVNFINSSSVLTGVITDYKWDFGDGTESELKEPVKQFLTPQHNTVTLHVTSDKGCIGTSQQMVNSYNQPRADFSIEVLDSCYNENRVNFRDQSNSIENYEAVWNIAGYTFEGKEFIYYGFTSPGIKNVRLIIIGEGGCIDSISKILQIYPSPNAGIVMDDNTQCLNGNVFNASVSQAKPSESYVWGLSDGRSFSQNSISFSMAGEGEYYLQLWAENEFGCSSTEVDTLIVFPNPQPEFDVEDVCVSNPVILQNRSLPNSGGVGNWIYGDGHIGSLKDSIYKYQVPGNYEITLQLISEHGCEGAKKSSIQVKAEPEANLSYKKYAYNHEKGETIYSFSCVLNQGETAKWYVNHESYAEGEQVHIAFKDSGFHLVELEVTNAEGCVSTRSENLFVVLPFEFYLPTAFTPNGDGVNDVYRPAGDVQLREYEMYVVNRWGTVVFHSNDLNSGWDGKFAGSLVEPGVYNVLVRIIDIEGEERKVNGSVLLIY